MTYCATSVLLKILAEKSVTKTTDFNVFYWEYISKNFPAKVSVKFVFWDSRAFVMLVIPAHFLYNCGSDGPNDIE